MNSVNSNLTFGYNGGILNVAEKTAPWTLQCQYGSANRLPTSFKDECIRTARHISSVAEKAGLIPVVMLSSGLDSEIITRAFIESGVKFKCSTFSFTRGLNLHETCRVQHFLQKHKVPHSFYTIDIEKWIRSSEAADLFFASNSEFLEQVPHMKLMLDIQSKGGYPVLGAGEVTFQRNKWGQWDYVEYEYDLAWYRFALSKNIQSCVSFFQCTSEMMLAMVRAQRMIDIVNGTDGLPADEIFSHRSRYKMYRDNWPDLMIRKKYDGGELLRPWIRELAADLASTRTMTYHDVWKMPVKQFHDMLMPKSERLD